jgi:catechol 2,3-dioxygenase-like lactoylglutathione lyase family enzyme
MNPIIDHIQITVSDLDSAEIFYDKFLLILGFDLARKTKGRVASHEFDVIEYSHPLLIFGINSPRKEFKQEAVHRRKPGALHHLAFKAGSKEEVDEAYARVKAMGADIVDGPRLFPQHGEHYYALFLKDPCGIKYEIVYEERKLYTT